MRVQCMSVFVREREREKGGEREHGSRRSSRDAFRDGLYSGGCEHLSLDSHCGAVRSSSSRLLIVSATLQGELHCFLHMKP